MRALMAMVILAIPMAVQAADLGGPRSQRPATYDPFSPIVAPKDYNWTGAYIGLGVGPQIDDTSVSFGKNSINGISSHGIDAGARIGYDYQFTGGAALIGVLAGYNLGKAKFTAPGMEATLEPTYYIGGRAGLVVANNATLLYAGYVYRQADLKIDVTKTDDHLNGHGPIAGIETLLTQYVTAGLEYGYTMYGNHEVAKGVSVEPDGHSVMARVNFRTGPLFSK